MNLRSDESLPNLTDEQKEIVACDLRGDSVLDVIAFAGTGKTTTLLEYAKARPEMRFLYAAFNRSVREEAEHKFPSNVLCKTCHSLAYNVFGLPHRHRLRKTLRLDTVKKALELDTYMEAKIVADTLRNYLVSADREFSMRHVPWLSASEKGRLDFYLQKAMALWAVMCDAGNREIGMLHDGYLKLYQLSRPRFDFDCIFLDEAQDTNPVVADLILSQTCPRILVGDPHQQIYAFRGAQDAMERLQGTKTLYLTRSFRFGEEIAWLANKILHTFKDENKKLVGLGGKVNKRRGDGAVIARTNAALFDRAVSLAEGRKIGFLGGIKGYRFETILDAYRLYAGKNPEVRDPFLRGFASFETLKKYGEEAEDWEIRSVCRVAAKYGKDIPRLVAKVKKAASEDGEADVVLTTAHKAKGQEFWKISICNDFPEFFFEGQLINRKLIPTDEFNLVYVAVTRSRQSIEFSAAESWAKFISLGGVPGWEKTLEYFGLNGGARPAAPQNHTVLSSSPVKNRPYHDVFLDDRGVERLNQIIRLSKEDRWAAAARLEDLMKDYPGSPQLWISMSIIRRAKHVFDKLACYFKAVELDPAFYDGYRRLGRGIRASAFRMAEAQAPERVKLNILLLEVLEKVSPQTEPPEAARVISAYPQLFTDDWQERYTLSLAKMKEGLTQMDRSRYSRELIEKFEAEYRMYSALPQEGRRYLIFTEYNMVLS